MADASIAAPSARAGSASPTISGAVAVGWLLAFILLEWARAKVLAVPPPSLARLFGRVSALECLELILIARLFNWRSPGPGVGAVDSLALLVLFAVAGVLLNVPPFFAAGVLSAFMLCRFGRTPEHGALAIAVFAFIAQYLLQAGPFIWLHVLVGRADAAVLRAILPGLGYDVAGYSTFVVRASQSFAINIQEGCASSSVASVALPGFVIVALGLRGSVQKSDLAYATLLLVAVVVVNWARLVPIALSRDGWLYWHQGAGGPLVAAVDGGLVVGAALLAVRWRPAAGRRR